KLHSFQIRMGIGDDCHPVSQLFYIRKNIHPTPGKRIFRLRQRWSARSGRNSEDLNSQKSI
ncbi:MAG: hypothetical protein PVI74_14055, partial [Syntrophobacterales bacterium]